jgi:hypothetical protein
VGNFTWSGKILRHPTRASTPEKADTLLETSAAVSNNRTLIHIGENMRTLTKSVRLMKYAG